MEFLSLLACGVVIAGAVVFCVVVVSRAADTAGIEPDPADDTTQVAGRRRRDPRTLRSGRLTSIHIGGLVLSCPCRGRPRCRVRTGTPLRWRPPAQLQLDGPG